MIRKKALAGICFLLSSLAFADTPMIVQNNSSFTVTFHYSICALVNTAYIKANTCIKINNYSLDPKNSVTINVPNDSLGPVPGQEGAYLLHYNLSIIDAKIDSAVADNKPIILAPTCKADVNENTNMLILDVQGGGITCKPISSLLMGHQEGPL